ncbi:hypothetical protein ABIE38_000823 [Dietzia sp. 2505]|uniref:hypothetical protein n=1 Tax=Dietzia sp. 2505 TaxID=3156457 RepID=UPI00339B22C9
MTWSAWMALAAGTVPSAATVVAVVRYRRSLDPVVRTGYVLLVVMVGFLALLAAVHLPQPADRFAWLGGVLVLGPILCILVSVALRHTGDGRDGEEQPRIDDVDVLPFHPEPVPGGPACADEPRRRDDDG